jgi:hypothetical protein
LTYFYKYFIFLDFVYTLLLYFRIKKSSIRKDGVKKFEFDEKHKFDLFDLILKSYSVDDVFKKINKYISFNLDKDEFNDDKLSELTGVKTKFLVKELIDSGVKNEHN